MAYYAALSEGYDEFFEADYLIKLKKKYLLLLKKNGVKKGRILDAGCGTGMMSMYLYNNGYSVIGADISKGMLIKARKKSSEAKCNIDWYNCDITKDFPFSFSFDAIISSLDVVNHITERKQLESFFLNAYEALNDGGVFIFDINSLKKFTKQYADKKYVYSSHHSVCVWQNSFNPLTELCNMNLEVFIKENGKYIKNTDCFYERYYSLSTVKHLIKKAGFRSFCVSTVDRGTRYIITAKKI